MPDPSALASAPATAQSAIPRAPRLRTLFLGFLRLGLTAFGGPAMIAQIKELAVRRRGWVDDPTFEDGVVLSQSLPGATAMQVAAWVGLRADGVAGAATAYVGLGLPAFVLMLGLSAWYARAQGVPSVLALMNGLQIVAVALIAHAAWTFCRPSFRSARAIAIGAGSTALHLLGVNPFAVVAASAAASVALFRGRPATLDDGAGLHGRQRARPGDGRPDQYHRDLHWSSPLGRLRRRRRDDLDVHALADGATCRRAALRPNPRLGALRPRLEGDHRRLRGLLAVMAHRFAQGIAWSVAGGLLGSMAALLRNVDVVKIVLVALVVSALFR